MAINIFYGRAFTVLPVFLGYNLYLSELHRNGLKLESFNLRWSSPIAAVAKTTGARFHLTWPFIILALVGIVWQIFRNGFGLTLSSRGNITTFGFLVLLLISLVFIYYRKLMRSSGRTNSLEKEISVWWVVFAILISALAIWPGTVAINKFG